MKNALTGNGSLSLKSNPREVEELLDWLDQLLESSALDEMSAFNFRCAVVEVVNNCIQHAYQNVPDQPIEITYDLRPDQLHVAVSDRGPVFLEFIGSELSGLSDESGRGFEIIAAWVSELHHERTDGWNVCHLVQKIHSPRLSEN